MQKLFYSIILFVAFGILIACQKHEAGSAYMDVATASTTYKVGDTVRFLIEGNPDNIVFFSGENGKKYENVNRTEADGTPILSFQTSAENGTQTNSLALMISTDFSGNYSPEGIAAATWQDITNKAIMSTGTANVSSGDIDLTEFRNAEKVYLAFKFTGQQDPESAQRLWTIKNFVLKNVLTDGTIVPLFANISAPSWLAIDVKNANVKWATPTSSQLQINGGPAGTPDNEDWIITAGVNLKTIAPDLGVAIKNITAGLKEYSYIYRTAGSYAATFRGVNHRIYGVNEVIKTVNLTINP